MLYDKEMPSLKDKIRQQAEEERVQAEKESIRHRTLFQPQDSLVPFSEQVPAY